MGFGSEIKWIDFGCCFTWNEVLQRLEKEIHFRLPTIEESIVVDFDHQAIWVSDIIGEHNCVMDKDWGCRVVEDNARIALVLVEK